MFLLHASSSVLQGHKAALFAPVSEYATPEKEVSLAIMFVAPDTFYTYFAVIYIYRHWFIGLDRESVT